MATRKLQVLLGWSNLPVDGHVVIGLVAGHEVVADRQEVVANFSEKLVAVDAVGVDTGCCRRWLLVNAGRCERWSLLVTLSKKGVSMVVFR